MTTRIRPSAYLRSLLLLCLVAGGRVAIPAAEAPTDLDQLVERALARRDSSWKTLPQLVLDERAEVEMRGPSGARVFSQHRDYTWFPRDGIFVRSPLRINGRLVTDAERQKEEADFAARERRRDARRPDAAGPGDHATVPPLTPESAEAMTAAMRPFFLNNNSLLMTLKYEPGRYGLVGRETRGTRDVVKVEYYPTAMFQAGRARPNRRVRERDSQVTTRLNKASLLTLWIDPALSHIVRYEFADIDVGFLPGQWLARVVDGRSSMALDEVLPGVWLPTEAESLVRLQSPLGPVEIRYTLAYTRYRRADVGARVIK